MAVKSRKQLEDALPDYFVGAVSAAVAKQIEDLATSDPEFAKALEAERQLFTAFSGPNELELDRAADHDFARLKARIESDEVSGPSRWFAQLFAPLTAVAAMLVVAIGIFIVPPEDAAFRTLSDSAVAVEAEVRVIFHELPSSDLIEEFEQRYRLRLHSGPDTANSFLFSIEDDREVSDVVRALGADPSLAFSGER